MRLKRSLMKLIATTMAVVMFLVMYGSTTADAAGLFASLKEKASSVASNIKEKITAHPVKSALVGIAAVGGAVLAAPVLAKAVGFAGGSVASLAGGAVSAVASVGAGVATLGSTVLSGLSSAGGFVVGALGAIGIAIGSLVSGIAGFVGGILSSPLVVPLALVGAAVAGYCIYKHYKNKKKDSDATIDIPSSSVATKNSVIAPEGDDDEVILASESAISEDASSELQKAHADYINAYNKYISLVANVGGSESPDEEIKSNVLRTDTQIALTEYREAYNKYITLLRQSNSK